MKIQLRAFFWKMAEYLKGGNDYIGMVASRDGQIYEIRENSHIRMIVRNREIEGLDRISEGVFLKLPKIPGEYLAQTTAFFRYYCFLGVEAAIHIYWDIANRNYKLICPEQIVNPYQVEASTANYEGWELVMTIHSHVRMPAQFSYGDNVNDTGLKIYGIIGKLHLDQVDYCFRARFNNNEFYLSPKDLFHFDGVNSTSSFPEEWKYSVLIDKVYVH
ncbi:hypothetical protein [Paenibacillus tepidiphilus]|uniref:hypothetical protein n=1 Tax=Paenibacillus tepidiphilus TaxID=2608683 RepID=UPI001238593B|nr:hypothetical protein [Paenibacillus tepidiphilus]